MRVSRGDGAKLTEVVPVPVHAGILGVLRGDVGPRLEQAEDVAEPEDRTLGVPQLVIHGPDEFVILGIVDGEVVAHAVIEPRLPRHVADLEAIRPLPDERRGVLALQRSVRLPVRDLERGEGHSNT